MKKSIIIIIGVLFAFLAGALLLFLQNFDPFECYLSMMKNSVLSNASLRNTFVRFGILTVLGLSAFIGFNSGVSNLGQYGQLLFGALAAVIIGLYVKLPSILLMPLMMAGAAIAGGAYAAIAGALKLFFRMNEFITTLMMNFISQYLISFLVTKPLKDPAAGWPMSPPVSDAGVFPRIGLIDLSVLIMIVIYTLIFVYWNYTKQGYELRMTGQNNLFALLGGCKNSKNLMTSMILSGMLAGIAGAFLIMGSTQQNKLVPSLGKANADDGIMIAIISGNSMASVLFFGMFFGMIQTGAVGMQLDTNVPMEFTVMLQATMVIFVVVFRDYSETVINSVQAKIKSLKIKRESHESVH